MFGVFVELLFLSVPEAGSGWISFGECGLGVVGFEMGDDFGGAGGAIGFEEFSEAVGEEGGDFGELFVLLGAHVVYVVDYFEAFVVVFFVLFHQAVLGRGAFVDFDSGCVPEH